MGHDNTSVSVASSYSQVYPNVNTGRYFQKEKKEILVSIPKVISEYNTNMWGVDLDKQIYTG